MAKTVDPLYSELKNYPHTYSLDTQFGDVDVLGHINNLAVARYYESARARFQMSVFGADLYGLDNPWKIVLVDNKTSYLDEVYFPQSVTVASGFSKIGNSSYVITQGLFRDSVCVGLCHATLVTVVNGKPTPLSDAHRQRMNRQLISIEKAGV